MPELNIKEILKTIQKIEKQAEKLGGLLPADVIMDTPVVGALIDIRGFVLDINLSLRRNTGAVLRLREVIDDQESDAEFKMLVGEE